MASLTHKIFASLKAGGDAALTPTTANHCNTSTPAEDSMATAAWYTRFMHVAVQGCCHGELDKIYDACAAHEQQTGKRVDLLICCGDFQAVRMASDLDSMAVPDKYKVMGDFHKYWAPSTSSSSSSSRRFTQAPYLTIFVGGNHENSDLLAQESYGGFVAPNIYYLGHAGVVTVDDCLRLAGLSGIFKEPDYDRPYPPRPYADNPGWKKGAYHVRRIEVAKLHAYLRAAEALQQKGDTADHVKTSSSPSPLPTAISAAVSSAPLVDMLISHDWPVGITSYGDEAQLLRFKPYFREDIRRHALGNPHTLSLLRTAKPLYWVAAHLHCYFEATVSHTLSRPVGESVIGAPAPTQFVALDKCAKGTGFLTFLDLPRRRRGPTLYCADEDTNAEKVRGKGAEEVCGASRIQRDPLWLEVLRAAHPYVAQNRTVDEGSGTSGGFDTVVVARQLDAVARSPDADSEKNVCRSPTALYAPTTAALLSALHLSPALPLQQPVDARHATAITTPRHSSTSFSSFSPSGGHSIRDAPSWAADAGFTQPQHRRSRTEALAPANATSFTASPPWLVADAPSDALTVKPVSDALSFAEDIAMPSDAPVSATLNWFEDTAS